MATDDVAFTMPEPGVPTIPLDRLELDSKEAARYAAESRPFVTRVDWPALQWTPDYLRQKVGTNLVPVWKRDGTRPNLSISSYLDLIDDTKRASEDYILHNFPIIKLWGDEGQVAGMEPLLADLRLPAFIHADKIREMFAWVRNGGWHDNKSHCEPNAAANFNVQLQGKKRVWLFSPDDAGLLGVATTKREELVTPPFFSQTQTVFKPSEDHPSFANVRCYETVLEPGDAVYIPVFWFHWFVHYDLYQLNFNVWFDAGPIPLSPISAEWSFMTALCLTLGGFASANEKFAALPIETQELLTSIATALVADRRCTDLEQRGSAKKGAPDIALDLKSFTKTE
ncbi:hypothetical protein BH11MYX1_BH11MYX1_39080 [soil metagenome]